MDITEANKLKSDALFSIDSSRQLLAAAITDHSQLIETFFVALSLHVLALPVIWCLGWALPWPKSPVVTSVIEIDLSSWPHVAKTRQLYQFRDPRFNQ